MPRMYPASVRRQIIIRLRSCESVAAIAVDTGICQATLFRWKRQALIDSGVIEGIPSVEADELAAAHRRIAALEAELALTRDACELFNDEAVVPPKRRRAITEGLIARGHSARSACRITGLARSLLQYHRRRPVPDREIRRLIVADTITEIHQRSRGTYGRRRIRAALLADYDERQPQAGQLDHERARSLWATTTGARHPEPDQDQDSRGPGEPAIHRHKAQTSCGVPTSPSTQPATARCTAAPSWTASPG